MNTENSWLVRIGEKEKEADTQTLRKWITQGDISATTPARKITESEWRMLSQREEFAGLFEKQLDSEVEHLGGSKEAKFPIEKALSFGWNTAVKNLGFFIPLVLAMIAFSLMDGFLFDRFEQPLLRNVAYLAGYCAYFIFHLGVIKVSLLFYDGETPSLGELFSQGNLLIKFALASILYGLIVLCGFILLIVPGVIWSIKFLFYDYLIVDKDASIIDSIKGSSRLTKGSKWELLGFGFVAAGINLLGALALGIGLFITTPVTILAYAYIYRHLERNTTFKDSSDMQYESASAEA